jgi:replicative DNA helicase
VDGLRAVADEEDATEIASRFTLQISSFAVDPRKESEPVGEIIERVHFQNDQLAEKGERAGVATGFAKLDGEINGIQRQVLTILAAPSSHGKTAFMLNLAHGSVEASSKIRAAIYSLEMSERQITNRLTSIITGIDLRRINAWKFLSEIEKGQIEAAKKQFVSEHGRLFFTRKLSTIQEIQGDARKRKSQGGLDVVFVDYLQLVRGMEEKGRTPEREINLIAWKLFELAQDLDCAVVALSQVTAAAQDRRSKRLSIDDLRDAKAIGFHARTVLMLQRPRVYDKANDEVPSCHSLLQLEKNSEGRTGDIVMHFDGLTQQFSEGSCQNNPCVTRRRNE